MLCMLLVPTTNIDVSDGLVNGARGEIVYIVTNSSNEVTNVLVKFDNEQVGMQTRQSSQHLSRYPNAVPLIKVVVVYFLLKANVVQRQHDCSSHLC